MKITYFSPPSSGKIEHLNMMQLTYLSSNIFSFTFRASTQNDIWQAY